jgi:DNA mismatch repair protein MutH
MEKLPYNLKDKQSIVQYAKNLISNTLREICSEEIVGHNYSGKGNFGQVLEKFYFKYNPNSDAAADFPEVGLELKSSPLKQLKNKDFRAKERLVLNIINYLEIVNQEFEESAFWQKNANLLLVFYLHNKESEIIDYVISLVDEWDFPETDLEIIRQDWEKIKQKVVDGKAHELSEGDTLYLGACTKGGKGGNLRRQPYNEEYAKQRAYSLKMGYVNHIIATFAGEKRKNYGKIIPSLDVAKTRTLEEIIISKFQPYYGQTTEEIVDNLDLEINMNAKSAKANLTKLIFGIEMKAKIEEFEKAGIVIKTVQLKANNLPKENMSFPAFEYEVLVNENWETANFKTILETKYLFVFYQYNGTRNELRKVKFWNMPYQDIEEAKMVWEKTRTLLEKGDIVKEIKCNKNGKSRRITYFPKQSEYRISHVRPHAQNSEDVYRLPVSDKVTGVEVYMKHCFWFNNTYIRDEIYLK